VGHSRSYYNLLVHLSLTITFKFGTSNLQKFLNNLSCAQNVLRFPHARLMLTILLHQDVINPNLEYQNYLSVFPSVKKKISIAKIRTNSHELYSETRCWSIHKTPWDERLCHLCDTKKDEDENHFLLYCPAYTHIRSHFQNICHTTNLRNLLTQQKYGFLGKLLLILFFSSIETKF
jgi:hypothetical protein